MESLSSRVNIPTPALRLHWPTPYCEQCLCEQLETIAHETYECLACKHVSNGVTLMVGGEIKWVRNA